MVIARLVIYEGADVDVDEALARSLPEGRRTSGAHGHVVHMRIVRLPFGLLQAFKEVAEVLVEPLEEEANAS